MVKAVKLTLYADTIEKKTAMHQIIVMTKHRRNEREWFGVGRGMLKYDVFKAGRGTMLILIA